MTPEHDVPSKIDKDYLESAVISLGHHLPDNHDDREEMEWIIGLIQWSISEIDALREKVRLLTDAEMPAAGKYMAGIVAKAIAGKLCEVITGDKLLETVHLENNRLREKLATIETLAREVVLHGDPDHYCLEEIYVMGTLFVDAIKALKAHLGVKV